MATKNLSAVIKIGGAVAGSLGSSILGTTKGLGKIGDAIKDIARQQEKIKAYDSTRSGMRKAIQDYELARRNVEKLGKSIQAVGKPTAAMRREMDQAVKTMHRAETAMDKERNKLHALRSELKAAGVDTHKLADEQKRLGDAMRRAKMGHAAVSGLSTAQSRVSELQGIAGGAFVGSAAATGSLFFPVKEAITFEGEVANVKKTVGGTATEVNRMGNAFRDLTLAIPVTRQEAMEVGAMAGQAGIARKEIVGYVGDALKMSKAFGVASATGSDYLQSFRAGLKLNQKQAMLLADAINKLGNDFEGVVSESGISEFIQRQGATLKAAGLQANEIAALGAAMLAPGTASEVAATGAKNMTNALTKGVAATKGQRWAFKQLGLEAEKTSKAMQVNAKGTIIDVLERISKQPKYKQSAIVSKLFGEESKGAIMPLLVNTASLEKAFRQVGDATQYAGSMLREYENQTNTTGSHLILLGNATKDLVLTIGQQLSPAVDRFALALTPVILNVNKWMKDNPKLSSQIVQIGAGLLIGATALTGFSFMVLGLAGNILSFGLVLKTVLGEQTLAMIIGRIGTAMPAAFGAVRFALGGLIRFVPLAFGVVTRLIGLIPGWGWVIAGVVTVIGLLIANWDKVGPVIKRAWDMAVGATQRAWAVMKPIVDGIGSAIGGVFGMGGGQQAPANLSPTRPSNVVPLPKSKGAGNNVNYTDNSKFNITIHPAGNLNEAAVATQLRKEMDRMRQQQKRAALYDHR